MSPEKLLRDRVVAPEVLPVPASTPELTWRTLSEDDVDALLECVREIDAIEHPHFMSTREDVAQDLGHSYVDLTRDSLVAVDADSRVVAYGLNLLSPGQDTLVRSILLGGVRPSHRGRGFGRQVLAWQEGRALQQFAASDKSLPGWMIVWADERATETIRLTGRFGFRIVRYFLELRRDLALAIEPRALDGFEVVPFTAERTEAVRLARNDAFQDHWGSQPTIEEDWREALSRSVFRRDLSFLAIAPNGDVAGFVLSEVNEEDFELQGFTSAYIELVGVTRQYRSRGVAAALLSRTLGAIADAGLEMAVLDVDSDSPTGALGLYTGLGFVAANRSVSLVREF